MDSDDRGKQAAISSNSISKGAAGREVLLFALCSHIKTPHGSIPVASERSHSPI